MSIRKEITIGLFVTIVGGIVVALTENIFSSKPAERVKEQIVVQKATNTESPVSNVQPESVHKPEKPKENQNTESIKKNNGCPNLQALEISYKTAKGIYYTKEKDKALAKVVGLALCSNQFDFALKVASSIYYTETKDDNYLLIVAKLAESQQYERANEVTGKIYYTKTKDKAKAVLIDSINNT